MPEAPVPSAASAPSEFVPTGVGHVFVYGTLRRGDDNDINRQHPPPRFVGTAAITGAMYHLGGYPGVVLGGPGTVQGEVYAIEPALERRLDEIEELYPQQTDEYFKRIVPVTVAGTTLDCIVYEINPRYTAGKRAIPSGDWVQDRHS